MRCNPGRLVPNPASFSGPPTGAHRNSPYFLHTRYDRASNRLWKENVAAANASVDLDELYAYDEIYQLVSAQRGDLNGNHDAITDKVFAQDWDLDATGNWTGFDEDADGDNDWDLEQSRAHNAVNETGTIGATTGLNWADPVYDRAGNMTSIPKPSDLDSLLTAKYDAWNMLVEVTDGEIVIGHFRYDGDHRRIEKAFDSQGQGTPDGLDLYEHIFLSGQQVIETRLTASASAQPETLQPKYQNVWSPRYIDALVLRDENTDTDGTCDDGRVLYIADANFNVTALVDASGNVVERYVYSPYGKATVLDPNFATDGDGASDYANTILYTGQEFDSATRLYYYNARYYGAEMGRFTTRDPIGYQAGDVNVCRYVKGRPLGAVDPTGQGFTITGGFGRWTYPLTPSAYLLNRFTCNCFYANASAAYGDAGQSVGASPAGNAAAAYFSRIGFHTTVHCTMLARGSTRDAGRDGFENAPATYCKPPCAPFNGAYIFIPQDWLGPPSSCKMFLNLIVTLYHECIHAVKCSGDEKLAYCNEARFINEVLRKVNPGGVCEGNAQYSEIVDKMYQEAMSDCTKETGTDKPWPTDKLGSKAYII